MKRVTWRDPVTEMEFVEVPIPFGTDGFWFGKHEVTVDQYMKFVRDTGGNHPEWMEEGKRHYYDHDLDETYERSDDDYLQMGESLTLGNNQVIGVPWYDAGEFASWLTKKNRKHHPSAHRGGMGICLPGLQNQNPGRA